MNPDRVDWGLLLVLLVVVILGGTFWGWIFVEVSKVVARLLP
jgi:hypothetical protein